MADNRIKRRKIFSGNAGRGMTRMEALKTMGVYAAGVSLFDRAAKDLSILRKQEIRLQGKIADDPVLKQAIGELEYLTQADKFIVQRRGNPVLTEIPEEKLPSIGLTRETWKLEIMADPQSNSELGNPMTIERGNAVSWTDLMELADKHAVRFLHVLTCTNAPRPYGMGLWEGVPLLVLLWKTEPVQNIRRIIFSGYHNDDPEQLFQSSLPVSHVLEESPGELPVILCYKLNGKFLSQANGGPVRLIVPGFYGNRSIKWLQKIMVTNDHKANDTYADWNNDVESPVKTCARFIKTPERVKTGEKLAITGMAQVGASGLHKVQYCVHQADKSLAASDPYLSQEDWHDAIILPPPDKWGSDLPGGKLPEVIQMDAGTNHLHSWPLLNTIVHWAAVLEIDKPGEYDLRCRTVDASGIAQPMPRPFGRSGINNIEAARLTVA
jgi:hypothetical protein